MSTFLIIKINNYDVLQNLILSMTSMIILFSLNYIIILIVIEYNVSLYYFC